ncbi:hypothetical protein CSKR_203815 [Clonorchis sinensis]|uniref:C-type lectin domain-containing protein n=1 Tax=Clonorchis sinensis TaxID=79923 RepID=A0A8T1N219_CLOSI|nr:hypothetical protein CSKR_203815 [Clonorchis sinensis]
MARMAPKYIALVAFLAVLQFRDLQANCSRAIKQFIPQSIRETGGYRLKCFESKITKGEDQCYVHYVRKMSFDSAVKACATLGARIITIYNEEHSSQISAWTEYSFYINAKRFDAKSNYFMFYDYPPKYTNIGCDTSIKGRDCMIVRTNGVWCTADCNEQHSVVCEF